MGITPDSASVGAAAVRAAQTLGKQVEASKAAAAKAPEPVTTTSPSQSGQAGYYHTRHKGGPILKDGVYQLKAGEHVLTENEARKARQHGLMAAGLKSLAKPHAKK